MPDRPYTLLSCGMSIDGYLGSAVQRRLLLSNDADFDRVDAVRADCDAILVGAATVRNDDPRLLVRVAGAPRRAGRPGAVAVADQGDRHRAAGSTRAPRSSPRATPRSSSTARPAAWAAPARGSGRRDGGRRRPAGRHAPAQRGPRRPRHPAADGRGRRQRAHAVPHRRPRRRAPAGRRSLLRRRLPGPRGSSSDGLFPWNPDRRATLAEVRQIGDVVLLRYALSSRFRLD